MKDPQEVAILLVEDDSVDQEAIRRALKNLRIANPLVVAENGLEALHVLRGNHHDGLERPHLVLLDLNMPRMNGHEFLQEIRQDKNLRDTVIFVLTTSSNEKDMVAAYEKNIAGYIVKGQIEEGFIGAINMLDSYWRVVVLPNGKH